MNTFSFRVHHTDSRCKARTGVIHTPHGDIKTPAFVPVGTQATVKSLTPDELYDLGVQLFFVNTYHTYLRPSVEVIKKFKGLHGFMGWERPLITDSGGFQVFSLNNKRYINSALSESAVLDREKYTIKVSKKDAEQHGVYPDDYRPVGQLVRVDDDGVTFTSHWDGSTHRFTPETSINIQHILGSDIMIAFDECAPYPTSHAYAKAAMERTHVWAKRSLHEHIRLTKKQRARHLRQALYGVIQGSVYEDLRKVSAREITSMDFDGFAIGGVSVGESKKEMVDVLSWVCPLLPDDKPRHLLGVGEFDDIFNLIEYGVDTFDCVQPTRLARMGVVYTRKSSSKEHNRHELSIKRSVYAGDTAPIETTCTCYTCRHYSRAYLHHLFSVRELLGYRLASIHNLSIVQSLTADIHESIPKGQFLDCKKQWFYNR